MAEPPTRGRVSVEASFGRFDVELWSGQCPSTCRWFVQQALDQRFHGLAFTHIRAGRSAELALSDDDDELAAVPTEPHLRLKYSRRGLVGLRLAPAPALFITLGPTPDFQGVHTLFGCVSADTRYVPWKLDLFHVNASYEPVHPPAVLSVAVVDQPFPDLQPRPARIERNRLARQPAQPLAPATAARPAPPKHGVRSDVSVLSFGDDDFFSAPASRPLKSIAEITAESCAPGQSTSNQSDSSTSSSSINQFDSSTRSSSSQSDSSTIIQSTRSSINQSDSSTMIHDSSTMIQSDSSINQSDSSINQSDSSINQSDSSINQSDSSTSSSFQFDSINQSKRKSKGKAKRKGKSSKSADDDEPRKRSRQRDESEHVSDAKRVDSSTKDECAVSAREAKTLERLALFRARLKDTR